MQIEVSIRTVYGARRIDPECDKARLFANIAGTKTLTDDAIEQIKALGYTVRVVATQPTEL